MSKALRNVRLNGPTAQTEQAKPEQIKNNAGGFVFKVSNRTRLDRFLIIGTDGGTYYQGQRDLTNQNVDALRKMLAEDASGVIERVVEVSDQGLAKSNSPALFTLALAINTPGVDRTMVKQALIKVARTATHLFEYIEYLKNLGGMGRAKKESISDWYKNMADQGKLEMQVVKYRQRNGWTHRDALRLAHPQGLDADVVNFVLGKPHESSGLIKAFEDLQQAKDLTSALTILKMNQRLPWEAAPTQFHKELKFWVRLFNNDALGQTALLRNVTRFAKLGAFNDLVFAADYANRLSDPERIQKGRVHPISYLVALVTYRNGPQVRNGWGQRSKDWDVNSKVSAALEKGFYAAFKFAESANKRTFVAIDCSGSMESPASGIDLSCAQVAGAVGMTIARTEPYSMIRGFTSGSGRSWANRNSGLTDLGIDDSTSLADAMRKVQISNWGGTDCSLPMRYALENRIEIDTFVIITDNDTWAGPIHPYQAIREYRKGMNINARLAVLGVSATPFTIADPSDSGMMDFVGFDASAPATLAKFSAGTI